MELNIGTPVRYMDSGKWHISVIISKSYDGNVLVLNSINGHDAHSHITRSTSGSPTRWRCPEIFKGRCYYVNNKNICPIRFDVNDTVEYNEETYTITDRDSDTNRYLLKQGPYKYKNVAASELDVIVDYDWTDAEYLLMDGHRESFEYMTNVLKMFDRKVPEHLATKYLDANLGTVKLKPWNLIKEEKFKEEKSIEDEDKVIINVSNKPIKLKFTL